MNAPLNKHGFALVCVLWILAILTVITLGFGRRTMLDARASAFSLDHTKALHAAKAAVSRGIVELQNKSIHDRLNDTTGHTSHRQTWAWPFDLIKSNEGYFDVAASGMHADDTVAFEIRDEESRISIATAPEAVLENIEAFDRPTLRKLSILRQTTQGTPFQTIEELRQLDDITEEDWLGDSDTAGLRALLTCLGDGRININTASADVLACIPGVTAGMAAAIVAYRQGPDQRARTPDDLDFATLEEIPLKTGMDSGSIAPLMQYCKVDSAFFTINGIATMRQGKVRATCSATVKLSGTIPEIVAWREEIIEP